MASEQRTVPFLRCEQIFAWRARGLQHFFLAEPCGVEDTYGAVLHMHQDVGGAPNKRAQTREAHYRSSKDTP